MGIDILPLGGDKDGESAKLVVVCLSDWQLLWAAMICEQEMSPSLMASLDHSIWFYCPVQVRVEGRTHC